MFSPTGGNATPPASIAVIAETDLDGFQDCPLIAHIGPSNSDPSKDNCSGVPNIGQENADGNFINNHPTYSVDDKTLPNSDAAGDACDPDDDNDGIADATESGGPPCASASAATDPLKLDTDHDGFMDGSECTRGTDPTNKNSKPSIPLSGSPNDLDKDKLSPADELALGTNPNDADSDGDQLPDGWEVLGYGTDPLIGDTDGDGVRDGCEAASINNDTTVNVGDQAMLSSEVSRTTTAPQSSLPNFDLTKDGSVNPGDQAWLASGVGSSPCP